MVLKRMHSVYACLPWVAFLRGYEKVDKYIILSNENLESGSYNESYDL